MQPAVYTFTCERKGLIYIGVTSADRVENQAAQSC